MAIGYGYPLLTIVMAIGYWLLAIVDGYTLLLWLLIIVNRYWFFWAIGYFEVQFLELGFSKVKH